MNYNFIVCEIQFVTCRSPDSKKTGCYKYSCSRLVLHYLWERLLLREHKKVDHTDSNVFLHNFLSTFILEI